MRKQADLLFFGATAILFLAAVFGGWWQSAGSARPIQVPMFYDAHYFFHRPWTQAQAAPGVPEAAPILLQGENRLTQRLSPANPGERLRLRLAGGSGRVTIRDAAGKAWQAPVAPEGTAVFLTLPAGMAPGEIAITISADDRLLAAVTGGDRLGSGLRLNEFPRPGNLDLALYRQGRTLRSWLTAIEAQFLPVVFQTRLQQYKPDPFKGGVIPGLLLALVFGSLAIWLAASPWKWSRPAVLTSLAFLAWLFLLVQAAGGRFHPLFGQKPAAMTSIAAPVPIAPAPEAEDRLYYDWAAGLWTSERRPEERFIALDPPDGTAAVARLRVPRASAVSQLLVLPDRAVLLFGVEAVGNPTLFRVRAGGDVLFEQLVQPGRSPQEYRLDLGAYGRQPVRLTLETANPDGLRAVEVDDSGQGIWLSPQIVTRATWLQPAADSGDYLARLTALDGRTSIRLLRVELPGELIPGQPLTAVLHWQAEALNSAYPTVFVHLRNEAGDIVTQSDHQPQGGAYPVAAWTPEWAVRDDLQLDVPADLPPGRYELVAGLYEPSSFLRWRSTTASGAGWPDEAATAGVWEIR